MAMVLIGTIIAANNTPNVDNSVSIIPPP